MGIRASASAQPSANKAERGAIYELLEAKAASMCKTAFSDATSTKKPAAPKQKKAGQSDNVNEANMACTVSKS